MHANNVFGELFERIKQFKQENEKGLIIQSIVILFVSLFLTFATEQALWLNFKYGRGVIVISAMLRLYIKGFLLVHIFYFFILTWAAISFRRMTKKDYRIDTERNIMISESGSKGTAELYETPEQLRRIYNVESVKNTTETIFGCTDGVYLSDDTFREVIPGDTLVSIRKRDITENSNTIIAGRAGTGKTSTQLASNVMSAILRGESFICTDTKLDICEKYYNLAKGYGYVTKLVNTDPEQIIASDSVNVFAFIGDFDKIYNMRKGVDRKNAIIAAQGKCETLAKVLQKNLNEKAIARDADFWEIEGRSFFEFLLLYVFFNPLIEKENKSLRYIYILLGRMKTRAAQTKEEYQALLIKQNGGVAVDLDEEAYSSLTETIWIEDLVSDCRDDDVLEATALGPLLTYINGTPAIKASVLAGAGATFHAFNNEFIGKVAGVDDVDLCLPAKRKCAYFFNMSDVNRKHDFLTAIFFTIMYTQMVDYANKQASKTVDIPVNFIFDEFLNIGYIDGIADLMSVCRSRGMVHTLCIQTLAAFKRKYPLDQHWEIMSNCEYWVLLGTNEPELAEIFSLASGQMTIKEIRETISRSKLELLKIHPDIVESQSETQRYSLTPDEVVGLKAHELLIYGKGKMSKVHTWFYQNHPLWKECSRYDATRHVPIWQMLEREEEERNIQAEINLEAERLMRESKERREMSKL